ncbi:MAG: FAD-dependent oxidoreductase [Vulcanimicrobiaceae bacterium]|jgi:2-polyprenyl-6-methoxyphenol hydroxylase-like FAD-dependent oxidoreductase
MSERAELPHHVRCCIAGGGPAGMMLGFLLARAGVQTLVLEKHADFFRDFRGDTIHPSTLTVMAELGLLDEFLQLPHDEIAELSGRVGTTKLKLVDLRHVPGPCKFIAMMPQWDFLNFLAAHAHRYPAFHLAMEAEVTDVVRDGERVVGVRVRTPHGDRVVRADLVVGADGRSSTVRARAGLVVVDTGVPIDVLWLRLSRREHDPGADFGNIGSGGILIAIPRGDYYQCAFVIRKDAFDAIKANGLPSFRASIAKLAPFLADRVDELQDWDQVKLLTVTVDHLREWALPGLLCIGDAAHAMSPIFGVGINLAIQDAIATANLLYEPLRSGAPTIAQLRAVQHRREWPTRMVQRIQVFVQDRLMTQLLANSNLPRAPWILRFLAAMPWFRRIPAYVVGIGFRPEHVRTPVA